MLDNSAACKCRKYFVHVCNGVNHTGVEIWVVVGFETSLKHLSKANQGQSETKATQGHILSVFYGNLGGIVTWKEFTFYN